MKSYLKFISIYFCFTMSSILFSIEKIAIAEKSRLSFRFLICIYIYINCLNNYLDKY